MIFSPLGLVNVVGIGARLRSSLYLSCTNESKVTEHSTCKRTRIKVKKFDPILILVDQKFRGSQDPILPLMISENCEFI